MIKKIGLILSIICSTAFSMEPPLSASQSQMLADLIRAAHHYGAPIQDSAPTVTSIIDTMKTANVREDVIACLESGKELLEMAVSLEKSAQEKGCTLWWRYTNSIAADIATGKNKSFGRTLLAGFINDGINNFKSGVVGFDTASTYVYWANAHYFRHQYLTDCVKVVDNIKEFISTNAIAIDSERLERTKARFLKFIQRHELDFNTIGRFHVSNDNFLLDMFSTVGRLLLNRNQATQMQWNELYSVRYRLSNLMPKDINNAIAGSLVVLPLTYDEEQTLLQESHNHGVCSYQSGVYGRGEDFHPRLTSNKLSQYYESNRLIEVYSQGRLLNPDHVKASFEQQLERLTRK